LSLLSLGTLNVGVYSEESDSTGDGENLLNQGDGVIAAIGSATVLPAGGKVALGVRVGLVFIASFLSNTPSQCFSYLMQSSSFLSLQLVSK
jgi:hypothetical protein